MPTETVLGALNTRPHGPCSIVERVLNKVLGVVGRHRTIAIKAKLPSMIGMKTVDVAGLLDHA
jgi:hypothetical protein